MPELPEVETTRAGIEPHILKQRIFQINVYQPKLRWPISDNIQTLKHQCIEQVLRRGKYLIIKTEDKNLMIHLGMSGYLQLLPKNTPLKKHDHFEIVLENGFCLRLNDTRRFGCVLVADNFQDHPLIKVLGPEPLLKSFNAKYLYQSTRNSKRPIKLLLMDAKIVVGVGNIYANEALFFAGILPHRCADSLSFEEATKLTQAIKRVLKQAIKSGGTTLKDFQNVQGKPGYFKQKLKVYGREYQACYNCDRKIKASRLGQRITLWCEGCQI